MRIRLQFVPQLLQQWFDDLEPHDGLVGSGRGGVQVVGVVQVVLPEAGEDLADGSNDIHHGFSTRRLSK